MVVCRCPECKQIIDVSASVCEFCRSPTNGPTHRTRPWIAVGIVALIGVLVASLAARNTRPRFVATIDNAAPRIFQEKPLLDLSDYLASNPVDATLPPLILRQTAQSTQAVSPPVLIDWQAASKR